jgi:hypothetical protein
LKSELGLSATQLGVLLSAFFWTYACLQIPAGWLVDHLEVKCGVLVLLWLSVFLNYIDRSNLIRGLENRERHQTLKGPSTRRREQWHALISYQHCPRSG